MELHSVLIVIISTVTGLLAVFGWSHKALRQRIMELEVKLHEKPNYSDARTIMADKLAPLQVEYHSLTRRMDDLRRENLKLNDKIDQILIICTKLTNGK